LISRKLIVKETKDRELSEEDSGKTDAYLSDFICVGRRILADAKFAPRSRFIGAGCKRNA
jgi:hypothetical protein